MLRVLLVLVGALGFIWPVYATTSVAKKSDIKASLDLNVGGFGVREELNESQVFGLDLLLGLQADPDEWFQLNLLGGFRAEAGSVQAGTVETYKPEQKVLLREASMSFRPVRRFRLDLGALNQKTRNYFAASSSETFPGVEEFFEHREGGINVFVKAAQTIPTGVDSSNPFSGKSGAPYALFEQVGGGYQSSSGWEVDAFLGHFLTRNLHPSTASESLFLGNSVQGIGREQARYVYGFQGLDAGAGFLAELGSRMRSQLKLRGAINLEGPRANNRLLQARLGLTYLFRDGFSITPELSAFRREANALPAAYTDASFGGMNRQGLQLGLRSVLFGDYEIELLWTEARAIADTRYQSDFRYLGLSLGRRLEIF